MAFKNAAERARWQRQRYAERRAEAVELLGSHCVRCGAEEDLQVDHVDPSSKTMKLNAMAMASRERFLAELAGCQLLCAGCHTRKSQAEGSFSRKGEGNPRARLTDGDVAEILRLHSGGIGSIELARRFGVSRQHVHAIASGDRRGS